MVSRKILFAVLLIGLSFVGCRKGPGPGGKATITGTINLEQWEEFWCDGSPSCVTCSFSLPETGCWEDPTFVQITPAQAYDVYIRYGNGDDIIDDNVETDLNGNYTFEYLLPGDYIITVYGHDPAVEPPCEECDRPLIAVSTTVSISSRKETVTAPELKPFEFLH